MPDFKKAAKNFRAHFENYKETYVQPRKQLSLDSKKAEETRQDRDKVFENLLRDFERHPSRETFTPICNFYTVNQSSGGWWTTPTLLSYIRQAGYDTFDIYRYPPKPKGRTMLGTMFQMAPNPIPETDAAVHQLEKKLKPYCTDEEHLNLRVLG